LWELAGVDPFKALAAQGARVAAGEGTEKRVEADARERVVMFDRRKRFDGPDLDREFFA
jgi:hypothetical protein